MIASRCTREVAEEIAASRNAKDPIQSRQDWWEYRDKILTREHA